MLTGDWYWEKRSALDYCTEHSVDVRWYLKKADDDKSYGTLRIVSHPDLKPGHLRSTIISIKSSTPKTQREILQTIKDQMMDVCELEVFKIDENIVMDTQEYIAPKRELEELYGVKIFS